MSKTKTAATLTKKKAKGRIVIDSELCKGCKYCINACPKGSIATGEKYNSMGYFPAYFKHSGKCTGCAICANMCPEIAIEVWKEEE